MQNHPCPICHTTIPENAPGGFCPVCILRDADEAPAAGPAAPPLAAITAAFPQLDGISLIGQGGMGFVYRARQPKLDRTIALKILSPALSGDPAFAERFAREARTLGKLQHPNIVTVFEHGESGGFFYLMMEYVDGVNLRQAMRAGRFTPAQALTIVPGICDALQYAHEQGVWHRDIKPENILLDREGRVKIADFGIARIIGDPRRDFTLTMTGNALGSAAYMAPEQHEKPHDVDHRADIYSLGVVIYEMLTGELPLGRFPSPSQRAAVDQRIDEIVLKTLEKERELRQQSATEVKTGMHRAMQAEEPKKKMATAASSGRFPNFPLSIGLWIGGIAALIAGAVTSPLLMGLGAVCAILGLLACVWILWKIRHGTHPKEHRLPLLILVFWPLACGIAWLGAMMSASITRLPGQSTPAFALSAYCALGFLAPLFANILLWKLLARDSSQTRLHGGIRDWARSICALGLIAGGMFLIKSVRQNDVRYNSHQVGTIQLYGEMVTPEDDHLAMLRAAVAKALGTNEGDACFRVYGPDDDMAPWGFHRVKTPYVVVEWASQDKGSLNARWRMLDNRLRALLPKSIEVNVQNISPYWSVVSNEAENHYLQARNGKLVLFIVAQMLAVLLVVNCSIPRATVVAILALGCAVAINKSPWPSIPVGLPPSIDGLAPLAPLPMPEYDFSTTRDAVESMIKAAKKGDVENFKRGLSGNFLETMGGDSTAMDAMMRNVAGSTYEGQVSQEGDNAKVNCVGLTTKVGHAVPMIREGGEWKVEHVVQTASQPRRAVIPPPVVAARKPVPVPTVPIEDTFRKAFAAANASDGIEFGKHVGKSWSFYELELLPSGKPSQLTHKHFDLLGMMELLIGDIVKLKVAESAEHQNGPEAYVTMRKPDGSIAYLVVEFQNIGGQWIGTNARRPNFRAISRIEFLPPRGDAAKILMTHLGFDEESSRKFLRAVEGKPGQFDVIIFTTDAESAKTTSDERMQKLHESLKKFSLETALKVISPAVMPDAPYMAEDAPPFVEPKP